MYHPDNISEYCNSKNKAFDKEEYMAQLTEAKNRAKDTFISTLALKRTEYPYFGEPEHNGKALQNRFKNKGENGAQSANEILLYNFAATTKYSQKRFGKNTVVQNKNRKTAFWRK